MVTAPVALAAAAQGSDGVHPNIWMWLGLGAVVIGLVLMDTFWLNKSHLPPKLHRVAIQAGGYVVFSLLFGVLIMVALSATAGQEYFTAYSMELTLSFDNVFAWSLIISALVIYRGYHQTLLAWGVAISVVLRAAGIIGVGSAIQKFAVIGLLLGAFLVYTGIKLGRGGDEDESFSLKDSKTYNWSVTHLPMTEDRHGTRLITRAEGGIKLTHLLVAVILVGVMDLLFATDSIPAVLAISNDQFVIVASVMMAVTCLKSLYFLYDAVSNAFSKVGTMLAFVLVFIGVKMFLGNEALAGWIRDLGLKGYHGYDMPSWISLIVVLSFVGFGIVWSIKSKTNETDREPATMEEEVRLDPAPSCQLVTETAQDQHPTA